MYVKYVVELDFNRGLQVFNRDSWFKTLLNVITLQCRIKINLNS